ncbi:DnaB-like helicase C-terminal domain-containing protein [Mycoplasma sp. 3686d]|uniref:DnaB-like helicase C-terminal domain-containing protein n=1 Tax=Mycoplasma sp. 3686d TaxID=2967300 RepID=UPI00211C1AFE|nr:DnaB-like helicase C-terminal domain-containing protein [Mycoplasma sp. 3686d]UUM24526.1 AAA family ATPase [Mycoplasma sp. 3686d]
MWKNNSTPNYLIKVKPFLNKNTLYCDDEIEKNVLASMILDEEMQQRGVQYLKEDNFFVLENKQLFLYISFLKNKMGSVFPFFDFTNLVENLNKIKNNKAYSQVNELLISYIGSRVINETHFLPNIEKLIDLTKMRYLEAFFAHELTQMSRNNFLNWENSYFNLNQFLGDNAQSSISNGNFKHLRETYDELQETIDKLSLDEEDNYSIKTKFNAIDNYVNGFKPGQFIILAARPGIGKTALALNIARNITLDNVLNDDSLSTNSLTPSPKSKIRNVAFISLEMPASELTARFLSTSSNVPLNKIQNPKRLNSLDRQKIWAFSTIFDKMNVYFDDVPTSNIDDIALKIRTLNKNLNYQLDLIIIDYLQLIGAPNGTKGNRQQEVSTISRSLKTLALELKVPILALSQLSRNVETREDKRPQLHDLRETGSLEQDADIVIFLSRNNENKIKEFAYNTLLSVAKNRNGALGIGGLQYSGEVVAFNEFKIIN